MSLGPPSPPSPVQVWLLLYNLLADGAARSRMEMSEARCEALLKLKRHFNELLLDQARGGVVCGAVWCGVPGVGVW